MISKVNFYDGVTLNLSGVMASKETVLQCRWMQRCSADEVRRIWDFGDATIITPEECVKRAEKLVALTRKHSDVTGVWIRSMKSAPFFYAYVEDAFLSAGYQVVIPSEEYNGNEDARYAFTQKGWWVVEPFEKQAV